ncbi:MAG TPA: hypothetical protein VGG15_05770 [Terriglobales bacterium]|jgi:hypothetical protein
MNTTATQIPADYFLDQVLSALVAADASMLNRLENAASTVAEPVSGVRYLKDRGTFAALLDMTGRNLRFLRRVTEKQSGGFYAPGLC